LPSETSDRAFNTTPFSRQANFLLQAHAVQRPAQIPKTGQRKDREPQGPNWHECLGDPPSEYRKPE
jgi:hypothetical protein